MKIEISSGDVVLSTAGKDEGKIFLVVKTEDRYAYLVDGKTRKADNPKRKSVKHLKVISKARLQSLSSEIQNGNPVGAKRIKRALANDKNIGG